MGYRTIVRLRMCTVCTIRVQGFNAAVSQLAAVKDASDRAAAAGGDEAAAAAEQASGLPPGTKASDWWVVCVRACFRSCERTRGKGRVSVCLCVSCIRAWWCGSDGKGHTDHVMLAIRPRHTADPSSTCNNTTIQQRNNAATQPQAGAVCRGGGQRGLCGGADHPVPCACVRPGEGAVQLPCVWEGGGVLVREGTICLRPTSVCVRGGGGL